MDQNDSALVAARGGRALIARLPLWAVMIVSLAALALALLTAVSTLSAQNKSRAPVVASSWSTNGFALANLGARLAAPASGGSTSFELSDPELAASLAKQALALEPTADRALSTLALIEQSTDPERALAMYRLNREMSRRNEVTSLSLAATELKDGNYSVALTELGQLFRIEPRLRQEVMPLIIQLLNDESALDPLATMLRRESGWSDEFWRAAPDYQPGLANLVALRRNFTGEPDYVQQRNDEFLFQALVGDGQFALAEQLAREVVPDFENAPEFVIRNAAFDADRRGRPFDWRVFSSATFNVYHDVPNGTLTISTSPGPGGVAVSQLARFSADRYTLRITQPAGFTTDSKAVQIAIRCADPAINAQREFDLAQALAGVEFSPVPDCEYHFVNLVAASTEGYSASDVVLDAIQIRPVSKP